MPIAGGHPEFAPPRPTEKLWRYVDLPKYLSLLSTRTLWFSRADLLGDPFEGSVPKLNPKVRAEQLAELLDDEGRSHLLAELKRIHRDTAKWVFISCWHRNEWESAAMWRLYMIGHGIAILSDYDHLREAIGGDEEIHVGRVRYIDYETALISEANAFTPFLHKRRSFEHEHEVRAVFLKDPGTVSQPPGIRVPADPARFIIEVHVAPDAPFWFADAVRDVTKRYGFDFPVKQSDLDGPPVH